MANPEYFRLIDENENFVGFKRIVTEYLPTAATRWQLDEFPHDPGKTVKLSMPAMGTATLGWEKITTTKQRRVSTGPRTDKEDAVYYEECPAMPQVKPPKNDDE